MIWLFVLAFLGSFSLGYSLLRTGFPSKQDSIISEKIGFSIVFGILVFIPGFVISNVYEKSFFLIAIIFYIILFLVFMAKRIYFNEKDTAELVEEKEIEIPQKIKKAVEKENTKKAPVKKEAQPFKDKKNKIIKQIQENTLKIKTKTEKSEKEKALEKLKGSAKRLDKKKNKEDEDIEELFEIDESDF